MNKVSSSSPRPVPALQSLLPELLAFLADPDRFAIFAEATGMAAQDLRAATADPVFAEQVFDYVCSDEARLMAFAAGSGHSLPTLDALRQRLGAAPDLS